MSRPSGLRKFVGPPAPAAGHGCAGPRSARAGPPRSPGPPRSGSGRSRDRPSPAGRRRGTLRVLRHRHTVRTRARGGPGAVQPRLRLPGLLPALHRSAGPGGRPPGAPESPGSGRHPCGAPPLAVFPGGRPPGAPREPRLGENTPAGRAPASRCYPGGTTPRRSPGSGRTPLRGATLPSPGLGALPFGPGPLSAGFVPADVRPGVGRAADPGRAGVLPEQLGARPGRLSTRARPAPPNAPWTWPRGSAWRPRIRCWARRNPTWRPCCCAGTATRPRRSTSSCRSTCATSWPAGCGCCGKASTAAARPGPSIDDVPGRGAEARKRCQPGGAAPRPAPRVVGWGDRPASGPTSPTSGQGSGNG